MLSTGPYFRAMSQLGMPAHHAYKTMSSVLDEIRPPACPHSNRSRTRHRLSRSRSRTAELLAASDLIRPAATACPSSAVRIHALPEMCRRLRSPGRLLLAITSLAALMPCACPCVCPCVNVRVCAYQCMYLADEVSRLVLGAEQQFQLRYMYCSVDELDVLDADCSWNGHADAAWPVDHDAALAKVIGLARDGNKPVCLRVDIVDENELEKPAEPAHVSARAMARQLEEEERARRYARVLHHSPCMFHHVPLCVTPGSATAAGLPSMLVGSSARSVTVPSSGAATRPLEPRSCAPTRSAGHRLACSRSRSAPDGWLAAHRGTIATPHRHKM